MYHGLALIKPSSVDKTGASSSVTITNNGSVSFTSCETFSFNNVFSSDYDNYMIVGWHSTTADYALRFRLRNGVTDDSTNNSYTTQYWFSDSTTVSASRAAANYGTISARGNTQRAGFMANLYSPYRQQYTVWRSVMADDYISATVTDWAGSHAVSTSYNGITFIASGGSFSGRIAIYGMRQ